MYGGLARRPEVTKDGFVLVICHELGHHLGGFPFYSGGDWAANEGQADYFATHACAHKMWDGSADNALSRDGVDPVAKQQCDQSYTLQDERDVCYRTANASQSLANLLAVLGAENTPQFSTPDLSEVSATYEGHPAAQCRLDTYFGGALCATRFNEAVIPGRNHPKGQESVEAEADAAQYSCTRAQGQTLGVRPLCWYKPNLEFLGMKYSGMTWTVQSGNSNDAVDPGETLALSIGLANTRNVVTSNIHSQLAGDSSINVLQGESDYSDIQPGATQTNLSPFVVRIADNAKCGSSVDVTLKASSDVGAVSLKKSILIGKIVQSLVGTFATGSSIPDGSYSGLTTKIMNNDVVSANKVTIALDITHADASQLRAVVVPPNGFQRTLFYSGDREGADVHDSFQLDMDIPNARGNWALRVYDTTSGDVGTLNSWSLTLGNPHCESAQ